MSYGILSYGAYVPPIRLQRSAIAAAVGWAIPGVRGLAAGERAVANWDEDSITLAVEAGRDCLRGIDTPVKRVQLASTTLPFTDRSNSGVVADALNLDRQMLTEDFAGSRRAASAALARMIEPAANTLLIGSDCRETKPGSTQEMLYGHGAAALLLGEGEPIANIIAAASIHEDLIDQYRSADAEFDYALEERWVREEGWFKIVPDAVSQALEQAGLKASDIHHVALQGSTAVARALSKRLEIDASAFVDSMQANCGDCGVGHPLLLLTRALDKAAAGERILVISFGQGADAIVLETTDKLSTVRAGRGAEKYLEQGRPTDNYTYYLSLRNHIGLDFGLRAERDNRTAQSAFYRRRRDVTSMLGGRCRECGTLQFPSNAVCVKCGATDSQTAESLADLNGRVKSFTEDWLAYTPSPPYIYGNVEFDGGANVMCEFTDFKSGDVAVGDVVRLVFRIKDFDEKRHFRRYFWKPAPLLGSH